MNEKIMTKRTNDIWPKGSSAGLPEANWRPVSVSDLFAKSPILMDIAFQSWPSELHGEWVGK